MASDTKRLVKRLRKQGFTVTPTGSGHLKVSRGSAFYVIPSTPGGGKRSFKNSLAGLKRIGFER